MGQSGAWLAIGALARASGIPVETLRTWESRYGFPAPKRKPSGHRVYPLSSVERLRRIGRALALGHRAGEVVPAADADLDRLLGLEPRTAPAPAAIDVAGLQTLVASLDAPRLTHVLLAEAVRLGPLEFASGCVAPLLRAVGEAWARGELEVRHEHLLSERLADVLRSLRLPLEERATGPLVLFATLPGETHALGLQMAALVASAAGCRVLCLGHDMPLDDISVVAHEAAPGAVALSISSAAARPSTERALTRLRALLPDGVPLVAGGDGALELPGVTVIHDLGALDGWLRQLRPSGSKSIQNLDNREPRPHTQRRRK